MIRTWGIRLVVALAVIGFTISVATADEGSTSLHANLTGFQETPPGPYLTDATGTFTATVAQDNSSLTYTLTYSGFINPVVVAHIHFGQVGVAGGVSIFLCGGGGAQACPQGHGTVNRTVTAVDVVGPGSQGVAVGDFAGVLRFIRAGDAYVNVHTTAHPGGEIRGQIHIGFGD